MIRASSEGFREPSEALGAAAWVWPRPPASAEATAGKPAADHAETATADFSSSVSSEGPAKEEGPAKREGSREGSRLPPRISPITQLTAKFD